MKKLIMFYTLFFLLPNIAAFADIYKCIGEDGIVTYSDRPCEGKLELAFKDNKASTVVAKFIDHFEYIKSPINNDWRHDFDGNKNNIFTSKEPFSLGSRSLKGHVIPTDYTRIGLRYDFSANDFGKTIKRNDILEFSMKFYDLYDKANDFPTEIRKKIL